MRLITTKIVGTSIILLGLWLLAFALVRGFYYAPEKEVALTQLSSFSVNEASSSPPQRIIIPKINLDTDVEKVGITYAGNMSTPKKVQSTGWYKYGTIPGDIGSAVIDGHVDNGFGLPGVFSNLKNLVPGDNIYIEKEDGSKVSFEVFDVKKYYYTDVPREVIFHRNDGAYLNLITCDGEWLTDAETSDHRLVVYAKLTN
jgi:sortase A